MDVFKDLYAARNADKAQQMSAYMKNNFRFLGIPTPARRTICKAFLKEHKQDETIDWSFVFTCFEMPEREFQYLGIEYIAMFKKQLVPPDIIHIEKLIQTTSWWDSVDGFIGIVGELVMAYPELKKRTIPNWIESENIWLIRSAINYQLHYKDKTDTVMLAKAILSNCETKEFFINKAIGWALREYSKTNPKWVKDFIETNRLHPLSVREGSKYVH